MTREEFEMKLSCDVPDNEKNIWIWGTGHTTELYIQGLKRLDDLKIAGFCDNNLEKWGSKIADWIVISPEELYLQNNIFVVISSWQKEVCDAVKNQLDVYGINSMAIDEYLLKKYRNKVLECYDSLYDQESRDTYAHIILQRMYVEMPAEEFITGNQYFALRPFKRYGKTVFVDCGAYTGDTIEKFMWNIPAFEKIYGFEPDPSNFTALKKRCERLEQEWNIQKNEIDLYNVAVGAKNGFANFASFGSMSSAISEDKYGEEVVKVIALDDIIHEKYSFLKADIEGFEYDMLIGAKNGIEMWKPSCALCIYHNAVDMFSILLLLKKMVPGYRFAVRHHSITFDETILYAWTEENESGWVL